MSTVRNLILERAVLPLEKLTPHPMNARRGDVDLISESLAELGQYRSVVVNQGTITGRPFEILAGHHVIQAMRRHGQLESPVDLVDVDDETAVKIMLVDNRSNDVSTYDQRLQAELLASLASFAGTGYAQEDLDALEALLREHSWEGEKDLQDALDEADEDGWPEVRCKLAPPVHARFLETPGADDAERLTNLLADIE